MCTQESADTLTEGRGIQGWQADELALGEQKNEAAVK